MGESRPSTAVVLERPRAGDALKPDGDGNGVRAKGEPERRLSLLSRRRSSPSLESGDRGLMWLPPVVALRFRVLTSSEVGFRVSGRRLELLVRTDNASCFYPSKRQSMGRIMRKDRYKHSNLRHCRQS